MTKVPATQVFGCDYSDLAAVITLAKAFNSPEVCVVWNPEHSDQPHYGITHLRCARAQRRMIVWPLAQSTRV